MSVKTNWHTVVAEVDTTDPFDGIEHAPPAETVPMTTRPESWGTPIEREPEREPVVPPDLAARFRQLLYRESELAAGGVTCPIKDRADTACSACPLKGTSRAGNRTKLCALGCLQEQTFMAMVTADAGS